MLVLKLERNTQTCGTRAVRILTVVLRRSPDTAGAQDPECGAFGTGRSRLCRKSRDGSNVVLTHEALAVRHGTRRVNQKTDHVEGSLRELNQSVALVPEANHPPEW